MTIQDIENYLAQKNTNLDVEVSNEIALIKEAAVKNGDEKLANYCWCLNTIFLVQKTYISAFEKMKSGACADAWLDLDYVEILLSGLRENYEVGKDSDQFHLLYISRLVKEYQKIFPYEYFFSRESVIKSEECSICGKKISLRKPCGHRKGKLYMGEQCVHVITDLELKAIAIVKDPFDKYARLEVPEQEYDYGMIEMLMGEIDNPYEDFSIETVKVKKKEFKKTGRNDLCPCGSGKKYKYCHLGKKDELMDHHIVHLTKPTHKKYSGMKCFGTWK